MIRLRHILVPTDFSAASTEAFATALAMARDSGARVTLFHVHHVPVSVFPEVVLPLAPELMQQLEHAADSVLDELCARAAAAGVPAARRTAFGATHAEICALAEELGVDLIVIATHGRGALGHAVWGSVAERVVRKAPCPVLTVRARMRTTFARP